MLEVLATNDKLWRKLAFTICKCKYQADDLVSEMYLKLANIDKEVNEAYVYRVIKSIFLNDKIKESKTTFVDIENVILSDNSNNIDDFNFEMKLLATKKASDKLKDYEKLIVEHSHNDGLRHFSRVSGISKATVQNVRKKHKEKSWQELKELETLSNKWLVQSGLNPAQIATIERITLMQDFHSEALSR